MGPGLPGPPPPCLEGLVASPSHWELNISIWFMLWGMSEGQPCPADWNFRPALSILRAREKEENLRGCPRAGRTSTAFPASIPRQERRRDWEEEQRGEDRPVWAGGK